MSATNTPLELFFFFMLVTVVNHGHQGHVTLLTVPFLVGIIAASFTMYSKW